MRARKRAGARLAAQLGSLLLQAGDLLRVAGRIGAVRALLGRLVHQVLQLRGLRRALALRAFLLRLCALHLLRRSWTGGLVRIIFWEQRQGDVHKGGLHGCVMVHWLNSGRRRGAGASHLRGLLLIPPQALQLGAGVLQRALGIRNLARHLAQLPLHIPAAAMQPAVNVSWRSSTSVQMPLRAACIECRQGAAHGA